MTAKKISPARAVVEPKLGNTVRCVMTGYTGIANQKLELLNGTVQLSVQPSMSKDRLMNNVYPDGMNLDVHMLDYVDDGVAARVTPVTANVDIRLGERVQDSVTGFDGIATAKHTFVNGCVYFTVIPTLSKDDKEKGTSPVGSFFEHSRLKKVSDGIAKSVVIPPVASNGRVPGGPATKMRRAS